MTAASELRPSDTAVEAAIALVLDAEHTARGAVTDADAAAAAITEHARAAARSLAERTETRIRAVRAAFEARTSAEVATLDAAAAEASLHHELSPQDLAQLRAAVTALVAQLTAAER